MIVRDLHNVYREAVESPKQRPLLPTPQRELLETIARSPDKNRVATDLVAGLTEEMAFELHTRLMGTVRGSILDAAAATFR